MILPETTDTDLNNINLFFFLGIMKVQCAYSEVGNEI